MTNNEIKKRIENAIEKLHTHVTGIDDKFIDTLIKNDYGRINSDRNTRFAYLNATDLHPISAQRTTSADQILKFLSLKNGYDIIAAPPVLVGYDKSLKKYFVYDGLTRMALSVLTDKNDERNYLVPCYISDMTEKECSENFIFIQATGMKKMKADDIFINEVFAGYDDAMKIVGYLGFLGLYVQGTTKYPVPNNSFYSEPNLMETNRKTVESGMSICKSVSTEAEKLKILLLAKNVIYTTFSKIDSDGNIIIEKLNPELFWALIKLFDTYPKARDEDGDLYKIICGFFKTNSMVSTQAVLIKNIKDRNNLPRINDVATLADALGRFVVSDIRTSEIFRDHPKYKTLSNHLIINKIETKFA